MVSATRRNTLILEKPHGLKSIDRTVSNSIPAESGEAIPRIRAPTDSIVREEKVAPGRIETWILCNLDKPGQEVTGKYLKQGRPDVDDRLQPAVRFEFDRGERAGSAG